MKVIHNKKSEKGTVIIQNNELPNKIMELQSVPQSFTLHFHDTNTELGKFFEKDGQLHFEGDVHESAKIFVDYITKLFNDNNFKKM